MTHSQIKCLSPGCKFVTSSINRYANHVLEHKARTDRAIRLRRKIKSKKSDAALGLLKLRSGGKTRRSGTSSRSTMKLRRGGNGKTAADVLTPLDKLKLNIFYMQHKTQLGPSITKDMVKNVYAAKKYGISNPDHYKPSTFLSSFVAKENPLLTTLLG